VSFFKNVNLDLAATADVTPGARGHYALKFRDSAGRELGTIGGLGPDFDIERATAPLVSSTATVLAIDPTGAVTAHPVAAFRVLRAGAAEPVYSVDPPEGAVLFQAVAGQRVVRLADGELFADLASATASVTRVQPEPVVDTVVEQKVEPEVAPVVQTPKVVGGRHVRR
jgi:hypothetical protein